MMTAYETYWYWKNKWNTIAFPPRLPKSTKVISLDDAVNVMVAETGLPKYMMEVVDIEYNLYPAALVKTTYDQIKKSCRWDSITDNEGQEGSDCDDNAEWYKIALKAVLPRCLSMYVLGKGGGHAFLGVMDDTLKFHYFNYGPDINKWWPPMRIRF